MTRLLLLLPKVIILIRKLWKIFTRKNVQPHTQRKEKEKNYFQASQTFVPTMLKIQESEENCDCLAPGQCFPLAEMLEACERASERRNNKFPCANMEKLSQHVNVWSRGVKILLKTFLTESQQGKCIFFLSFSVCVFQWRHQEESIEKQNRREEFFMPWCEKEHQSFQL